MLEFDTERVHTELPVIVGIELESPKLGDKIGVSEKTYSYQHSKYLIQ